MIEEQSGFSTDTYQNPVYPHSFPDPYVLKYGTDYYGYSTDFASDGNVFGVIHSHDLVNWTYCGGAMKPLDPSPPFYWAPEVTYYNGKFYLYYSVGNETLMEIRVAVSDRPDGGFVDAGKRLTFEEFAIDAHVFFDTDGTRYLFYATDFLEHTHIGTGTVVDRMVDWFTLEGNPRPVTRAKHDWQVYDPARKEKGGVRWHTVEGPTVLKRKGRYYEMFSGGNWQNTSYGVSFAVTDDLSRPDEWEQHADGNKVLPILRTMPGVIVGPGHNSVVRGPNNRELYCIYHRWTEAGRVLAIDRMDFAGPRLYVAGATFTPQPCPFTPSIQGFGEDSAWRHEGNWKSTGNTASSQAEGLSEARYSLPASFLSEVMLRQNGEPGEEAAVGFSLRSANGELDVSVSGRRCSVQSGSVKHDLVLDPEFDPASYQHARIEVDGLWARIGIEEQQIFEGRLTARADELVLYSNSVAADFSGFSLTTGFQDDFDRESVSLADSGWNAPDCGLDDQELLLPADTVIGREQVFGQIDFAANIRLNGDTESFYEFGFELAGESPSSVLRMSVDNSRNVRLEYDGGNETFALPEAWQPQEYYQYRLLARRGKIYVYIDGLLLGESQFTAADFKPAIFCRGTGIALDMVRATAV
jgi:GH43 family beta-xylosidase